MWPFGWHMGGGNWLWGLFGILLMIAFWVGIIVLAFFAIRAIGRSARSPEDRPDEYARRPGTDARGESALEILQARYARGEISREEYLEMKRDLET